MNVSGRHLGLALTGAIGAPYFLRLVERLRGLPETTLHVIASAGGLRVLAQESPVDLDSWDDPAVARYNNKNIGACIASGSFRLDALVIVPCSMNTLCAVASGLAGNLIQRTAAVQLKERRKLIVVPRETPLSLIGLRAMTALAEAGAVVLPAMPAFYHHPQSITDLVDSVVDRILDQIGIADPEIRRWNP